MDLKLFRPINVEEACKILAEKEGARPLAGGTDILSSRERGVPLPPALVCLTGLGLEGLARGRELSALQSAFVREGAVQCGYCTPGMLMSGSALLKANPRAGEQEIKEALSGNLCRCTGYKKIIRAVKAAGQDTACS